MKHISLTLMILLMATLVSGCVSTGGPQMEHSVYDTNNRVKRTGYNCGGDSEWHWW